MRKKLVLGISFGLLAGVGISCSNSSVIYPSSRFGGVGEHVPDAGLNPQGIVPRTGKPTQTTPVQTVQSGMVFVLDPAAEVSSDDAVSSLFPDNGIDGVDLRTALEENEYTFDMQFKVEKTSETTKPGKAYLDGTLKLKLAGKTKADILLVQNFKPDGDIVLSDSGDQDTMTATFRDINSDGIVISIEATRVASPDVTTAQKNAWRGVVKKLAAGKSVTLGRIDGFLLPVDDSTAGSSSLGGSPSTGSVNVR